MIHILSPYFLALINPNLLPRNLCYSNKIIIIIIHTYPYTPYIYNSTTTFVQLKPNILV